MDDERRGVDLSRERFVTPGRRRLAIGIACVAAVIGSASCALDLVAERALEGWGSEAVGAEVRVGSVDVSLLGPRLVLHDLVIENPAGFDGGPALSVARLAVTADLGSPYGSALIVLDVIAVGFDLRYSESGDRLNLDAIESNVRAFLEQRGFASGPRIVIALLHAREGRATAPAVVGRATVPLEELTFRDIGLSEGGLPPPALVAAVFDRMQPSLANALAHTDYGGLLRKGGRGIGNAARKLKGLFD